MIPLLALTGVLMKFQIAAGDPHALAKWSAQASYAPFATEWDVLKPYLHATRAVEGWYTPYGALCELLQGTGLSFRYDLRGEPEMGRRYYIGIENSRLIPPYEDVCPTLTWDTPPSIDTPRAEWR